MRKCEMVALKFTIPVLLMTLLGGCGRQESSTPPPAVALHEAVATGNLEVVRQYIAAGMDLDEREPVGGSTPLITAAAFGQRETARLLIDAGADLDAKNNDGSTALMTAAFLCRTGVVELLLTEGADKNLRNNFGSTPLEAVSAPWDAVKPIYDMVAPALAPVGLELDFERIKTTRPRIAELLR